MRGGQAREPHRGAWPAPRPTPAGRADENDRTPAPGVTVKGVDLTQALLDKGLAAKPGKARFGWCGGAETRHARGPVVQWLSARAAEPDDPPGAARRMSDHAHVGSETAAGGQGRGTA
jgi:hypothetical protein